MLRRDFCKLMAAAAAARTVRLGAQSDGTADSPTFHEFNTYSQDYAQFCATPAGQRHFYALENGKFVKESLDEKDWKPTEWGEAPELPVSGGSWDGVPMDSPIPAWRERDRTSRRGIRCCSTRRRSGIAMRSSASGRTGVRNACRKQGDWYARNMYIEGSAAVQVSAGALRASVAVRVQGSVRAVDAAELGAGCADRSATRRPEPGCLSRWPTITMASTRGTRSISRGTRSTSVRIAMWSATWAAAARKQGLRFGVTVHQARNWWWFQTSHGADKAGSAGRSALRRRLTLARRQGASGGRASIRSGSTAPSIPFNALPDVSYVKNFYDRTRDLIDQHDPDLLYFDNSLLPLGWGGMNIGVVFLQPQSEDPRRQDGGRAQHQKCARSPGEGGRRRL